MNNVYNILKQVEQTTKSSEKEAILLAHKDDILLKTVFEWAYSPTMNFWYKKGIEYTPSTSPTLTLEQGLKQLREVIADRKKTGEEGKAYLINLLSSLSEEDASVVERVVKKDLRCGAGESLANKIWKGLIVKPPRMGCKGCSDENIEKLRNKRKAVEKKEDGSYMSFFGGFMSRSGQPVEITPLEEHLQCGAFDGYALEGEVVFHFDKACRELNGIVNKFVQGTASYEEQDSALYSIWEAVKSSSYKPKGVDSRTNKERRTTLENMYKNYIKWCEDNGKKVKVKLIERTENVTVEEAYTIFEQYVKSGFEGAILKDMDAPWKDVDKPSWNVKMKRQDPADLLVVDIYEGTGKAKGTLGGLVLESSDGYIKTSCGSGFSDDQRVHYWQNKNDIVGKVVEIEYEQVTQNDKTKQHSVSFPIFQKVRLDKMFADSYDDILEKQRIKVEV